MLWGEEWDRRETAAGSSTEIHRNSYYGLSDFLYSTVWKHSKVTLTFFLFLRVAGFAFEQRSTFSRSSISTRTCENGLLAICSISTNNLWTKKCILHILHIKFSNIIVLYYKHPRNKGGNSAQSWKTLKSITVMGFIHVLDRVQKKAAKFAHHMNESNWETLSQHRKISRICALFKVYSGEWAWKAIGDRLQQPNYLSRVDHEWKIRNRRQSTDIRKYSFVNRTIRLWNRLPAEILGTLPC